MSEFADDYGFEGADDGGYYDAAGAEPWEGSPEFQQAVDERTRAAIDDFLER